MKTLMFGLGLFALGAMKAMLVGIIWLMVVSARALIGAARVLWVWRSRQPGSAFSSRSQFQA